MARNRYFEDETLQDKFNSKMLKSSFRYARPYRKSLFILIGVMIVMSFVALIPPMLNRYIIDYVFTEEGLFGLNWYMTAILLVSALLVTGLSDVIYSYFRNVSMKKFGHGVVYDMRSDLFDHLQRLSFDYFDSRPSGKILVRVTTYLDELANVFSSAIVIYVVEITKIALIFVWLMILNWLLALIVLAVIVPMTVCILLVRKILSKRHRILRNKVSNRTAYLAENIQGAFVSKAFNRGKLNGDINYDLNTQSNTAWLRITRWNLAIWPIVEGFFYIGLYFVYAFAVYAVTSGAGITTITIGELIAFVSYMGMFSGPLNNISNVTQQLTAATTNLERVFETMDTPPSIYDQENSVDLDCREGAVRFRDVTFGYETGMTVLEHFELDVPAGKTIALVGPTGAGKSTVVNLISRFYDVWDGAVEIDGQNIAEVKLHSLRTQVGVMMQDSFVFSGTIIDNIRYARPEATDAECIAAAEEVHADEFIKRLPDGYYTATRENGKGLSAGERQLLSFARVILTDPKILILDEATSSIDTETEAKIKTALDIVLKNRTSFVIAHRLSTIRKADCILYIANKGIAEAGTHEQLLKQKGLYYALVNNGKNPKKS